MVLVRILRFTPAISPPPHTHTRARGTQSSCCHEQVEATWRDIVQPFVRQHPHRFGVGPERARGKKRKVQPTAAEATTAKLAADDQVQRLYRWATAVVAAYSFELGDDCFQVRTPPPPPFPRSPQVLPKAPLQPQPCRGAG